MPKSMTEEVSGLIVQALQRGISRKEIAGVVGVSRRAITRISTNLRVHGAAKAPPSGLKQGRPIKMTEAQAHAMLGWMAGRNYTFYIKDLTQFLKQNHQFEGCDGTVRRALIRAGFTRKLPWHKSEITAWTPPDGPPDLSFVTNARPASQRPRSNAATSSTHAPVDQDDGAQDLSPSELDQLQDHANEIEAGQPHAQAQLHANHHPGIDPALEAATILTPAQIKGSRQDSPDTSRGPLEVNTHSATDRGAPIDTALPSANQTDFQAPLSIPPKQQRATRRQARGTARSRAAKAAEPAASPSPAATSQPSADSSELIFALQSENARQRDLIAQLHRQLATGSFGHLDVATAASAASAAATASAAMDVQNQQQASLSMAEDARPNSGSLGLEQPPKDYRSASSDVRDEQLDKLRALIAAKDVTQGVTVSSRPNLSASMQVTTAAGNHGIGISDYENDNEDEEDDDDAV